MCKKMKILDDFCWGLFDRYDFGYGTNGDVLFVSRSNPDYLIKRVKSFARKIGVNFKSYKDYIEFFVKD